MNDESEETAWKECDWWFFAWLMANLIFELVGFSFLIFCVVKIISEAFFKQ